MLITLALATLLGAQEPTTAPTPEPPKAEAPAPKPLSFISLKQPYRWNTLLPLDLEVDGLKVSSIFFDEREPKNRLLKGTKWGHRAQLQVTNTASKPRKPGFAVAVFDEAGNLVGVASGGTKFGTIKPRETETFDLNFYQVKQRLPRGTTFVLSLELRD